MPCSVKFSIRLSAAMNKFKAAFSGLFLGLKDRSVRVQYLLALAAVVFFLRLGITVSEWIAVSLAAGFVIAGEMLNTAIEMTCNLYTTENNSQVRMIKDISAGAVLVAALTALITGILICFNHLEGKI